MLKYTLAISVVLLIAISYFFFNKEAKVEPTISPKLQETKKQSDFESKSSNKVLIQQTNKSLAENFEDIPDKVEPSNNMKKIRTKDGFMMLYDTKGRIIKKESPEGRVELYNYTPDGEKVLVEN